MPSDSPEADQKSVGRRCDMGCESWPNDPRYKTCPRCGQPTTKYSNLRPLDAEEALSIVNHIAFEEFYAQRCAASGIPVDGPLGEDLPVALED